MSKDFLSAQDQLFLHEGRRILTYCRKNSARYQRDWLSKERALGQTLRQVQACTKEEWAELLPALNCIITALRDTGKVRQAAVVGGLVKLPRLYTKVPKVPEARIRKFTKPVTKPEWYILGVYIQNWLFGQRCPHTYTSNLVELACSISFRHPSAPQPLAQLSRRTIPLCDHEWDQISSLINRYVDQHVEGAIPGELTKIAIPTQILCYNRQKYKIRTLAPKLTDEEWPGVYQRIVTTVAGCRQAELAPMNTHLCCDRSVEHNRRMIRVAQL